MAKREERSPNPVYQKSEEYNYFKFLVRHSLHFSFQPNILAFKSIVSSLSRDHKSISILITYSLVKRW